VPVLSFALRTYQRRPKLRREVPARRPPATTWRVFSHTKELTPRPDHAVPIPEPPSERPELSNTVTQTLPALRDPAASLSPR
jgi:hypothetical protein